jgi:hypothetical protein
MIWVRVPRCKLGSWHCVIFGVGKSDQAVDSRKYQSRSAKASTFCLTQLCRSIYHGLCSLHQNAGLRHLLQARGFYGELDDVVCPTKSITSRPVRCGDFRHAKRLANV